MPFAKRLKAEHEGAGYAAGGDCVFLLVAAGEHALAHVALHRVGQKLHGFVFNCFCVEKQLPEGSGIYFFESLHEREHDIIKISTLTGRRRHCGACRIA